MYELLHISDAVDFELNDFNRSLFFMKSWVCGYLVYKDTAYPGMLHIAKMFHDGTKINLNGANWQSAVYFDGLPISRVNGKVCTYKKDGDFIKFLPVDEFLGMEQPAPFATMPEGAFEFGSPNYYVDEDMGIALYAMVDKVSCRDLVTGLLLWELPYTFGATNYYPTVQWVDTRQVMIGHRDFGKLFFIYYDLDNGRIMSEGKVDICWQMTYDPVNQVILTLGTDKKLRVYYPKGLPAVFVGPTVPSPIARCGSYEITAQLLGDGGEPCEGWRVNWYLNTGKGFLQKEQTLTDAEGKVKNVYLAPTDVSQLGWEAVRVEVVI